MGFFTQLDWAFIGMAIAIVAVQPFGSTDWHDKYKFLKSHKEKMEEKHRRWSWIIYPPSWVYFFLWFFVDGLLVTGIYTAWRLIPTGDNYSVTILVLWFTLILSNDITSYLFYKHTDYHYSQYATASYSISVGVILTVLTAIKAHRLDEDWIYLSTATFGTFTAWALYSFGMLYIATGYQEILKFFIINPYEKLMGKKMKSGKMKEEGESMMGHHHKHNGKNILGMSGRGGSYFV